jgi:precorrin-6Y C5,15-methyltransferase (decarboxylating)
MNQTRVHLIGVEGSGKFSEQSIDLIRNCRALILSKRHRTVLLPILDDLPALRLIPIAPVQDALAQTALELTHGDVVVLATGDPLFFGIGRTLLHFFSPERVEIYPALSSMQIAFSRFKIPWDDARFLSLHGRGHSSSIPGASDTEPFLACEASNLAAAILNYDKLFLFTDQRNSPDQIASSLLHDCGSGINADYVVHVAENLGMDTERLHTGPLTEIAECTFGPLNVMILVKRSPPGTVSCFGLSEEEIAHSRGLITKNEVRAASLHALRLPRHGVFWDVGAGSGAIGLEAARLFPELQVFAVEREDEQIQNIQSNREQFHTWNLQLRPGSAPDALAALPTPDRVFIGGSGGQLRAIIEHAAERLAPGGRIVVNAVLEKTAQDAPVYLHEQGLKVTLSEIKVTRRCYPEQTSQAALHPITIIVGQKAQSMDAPVSLEPWTAKERQNKGQESTDE